MSWRNMEEERGPENVGRGEKERGRQEEKSPRS